MKNQKQTIRKIVNFLNNKDEDGGFWLPNIQRPFVWGEDQICKLFDSILREYPISTLLIWKTTSGIRRRKFIENWKSTIRLSDFYVPEDDKKKCLVLDGQQRLQSLFIGLSGSFEGRELYFDILSGEVAAPDDVKYQFEFLEPTKAAFPWIKFKDLIFTTKKKREHVDMICSTAGRALSEPELNKVNDHIDLTDRTFKMDEAVTYQELDSIDNPNLSLAAIAKLTRVVDGEEKPIGREAAEVIQAALVEQKMLDGDGRLQPAFDPKRPDFKVELPESQKDLAPAVVDLLASFQIERHVRRARDEGNNRLRKEITLSPEFAELWKRIKPKTTYRVEFATDELIRRSVYALKQMERIEKPRIRVAAGKLGVEKGGVTTQAVSVAEEKVVFGGPVPDLLAYLQNETELTRSTLVRVLKESGKLAEFFNNPQRFMDTVAGILKNELHRLLVDGIKYERISGEGSVAEWEMLLFKDEELINYLKALQVEKSVYEYVVYDSEIEREFAKRLNERDDIKLFVKLPNWFLVDTPIGKYNPDWAILKQDGLALYLVRETKGTRDYLKLRTSEADKVRCGEKHFDAIGVPFDVVVSADDV